MSKSILFALSVMLLACARGDHPIWLSEVEELPIVNGDVNRNNEQVYRLPGDVVPLEYDIYIDMYFSERQDRPFSFDGKVFIKIQAVEENVKQIVLHANVDSINAISLLADGNVPVNLNPSAPFIIEQQYHFLKVNVEDALELAGNYTLVIEYSNTMNEGPMKRGIWRGWYTDADGVDRIYATTHFQPYNARQAFPCWDEPLYKAVFKVHLTKPASYSATFSNTEVDGIETIGDRVRHNFYESPKMSSYLVTFLVSDSFQVIAEDRTFNPPIRIIGRSNTAGLGGPALELAVGMTKFFDEYFQMPYSTLHPRLLNDHISSPDWASAGTENWGMVSYRELYLILDSRETIMSVEHYAATLVSHELAHKWFGNLITCYWWSNTWINEGFASYFGYIAAHEMFPKYDLHEHFNSRYLQTSLAFDSSLTTVPLNYNVNTPAQVTGHFGTISYSKGAAFLRMVVGMITPATFRKACQYFLRNNSYEPTDQHDLFKAFEQAVEEDGTLREYENFDFAEFYRIWVNEAGYPILKVEVDHSTGTVTLQQERFYLNPNTIPSGVYPIPITYSTKSNPDFDNLKPRIMMSSEKTELNKGAGEEWVIFNNLQHGHYRVDYDQKTWNLIGEALLSQPETIHYLNRAQIVDDVFALMRSTRMTYDFGFRILRFLRDETNYHVWNPAISGFTWLRNRLRHIPEKQAEFDSFILSQMETVIQHVGYEPRAAETPTVSMTRQEVLHFACALGHEQAIQALREKFVKLRDNGEWVDARIRRNVYVVGIREGGEEDYNFLLNRFRNSNYANDQLEMLRGLAATKESYMLLRYLALTLTREVRSHDKANSFNYALLGNQENANTVLQFVKSNIVAIRNAYVEDAPANPVHTIISNLAGYLDEAGLAEYEAWLRSTQADSAQFNTGISAINSARTNMDWGTVNADAVIAAARGSAVTAIVSTTLLAAMAMFAVMA